MSLIEFAYNRTIHRSIGITPFECVYGFNALTPLDLTPLPKDVIVSVDAKSKAKSMKSIHEKVKMRIKKAKKDPTKRANKGRKKS